jgi:hypothetical protein
MGRVLAGLASVFCAGLCCAKQQVFAKVKTIARRDCFMDDSRGDLLLEYYFTNPCDSCCALLARL